MDKIIKKEKQKSNYTSVFDSMRQSAIEAFERFAQMEDSIKAKFGISGAALLLNWPMPDYYDMPYRVFQGFVKTRKLKHLEEFIDLEHEALARTMKHRVFRAVAESNKPNGPKIKIDMAYSNPHATPQEVINWWRDLVKIAESLRIDDEFDYKPFNRLLKKTRSLERLIRKYAKKLNLFKGRGGRPIKLKLPLPVHLRKEYDDICKSLDSFLKKNYSECINKRNIVKRPYLSLRRSVSDSQIDEMMRSFYLEHQRDRIPYLGGLSKEPTKKTDTVPKIVKLLLAHKYKRQPSTIAKLIKKFNKAK